MKLEYKMKKEYKTKKEYRIKKKCKILAVLCTMTVVLSACSTPFGNNKDSVATESTAVNVPDLSQIRSICELATLECYYHNVAKSVKTKGTGLLHVGEKERTFWIEYTGVAKIGIDMSEVKMKMDGMNVVITIPKAKLINYKVESISKENYISSSDSWFNKNPISAEEQTVAVNDAQEEMKSSVEGNTSLLVRAQDRAKTLIENYVTRLGEASGLEYKITWEYSEDSTSNSSKGQ